MRLTRSRFNLTLALAGLLMLALFLAGPIAQPANYHQFADLRALFGIPHAADVLSNAGFLAAGLYGLVRTRHSRHPACAAWRVFFVSLLMTAFGSAWYHLAPDNARLVWDRLPIALACASLLAVVMNTLISAAFERALLLGGLCAGAVASVLWWVLTADLRPYLMVQIAPMLLIPVLQWQAGAPAAQRRAFGLAIGLYALAKLCELGDAALLSSTAILSGHTAKHLAATAAAFVLVRAAPQH